MTKEEFKQMRKRLDKTQKELAILLGVSIKTIHSYEQGWRIIPLHIEKMLYFLIVNSRQSGDITEPCWVQTECTKKHECPAWEFKSGSLCWFLNGTLCDELAGVSSEREKLNVCKRCKILANILTPPSQ